MNLKVLLITIGVLVFIFIFDLKVNAQSVERIAETLNHSDSSLITNALRDRLAQGRPPRPVNASVVKFRPVGDSGVMKILADTLGANAQQKAGLMQVFSQVKQAYEAEVAPKGKSNNLAAAFTFFIAANVMAYHQTDEPSDQATETLVGQLEDVISSVPEFARMSDSEKHKMHDWLVCMGGFSMMGYMDAKQTNDKQGLGNYREFANYSMRLVLGIEVSKLSFRGNRFFIENDNPAPQTAKTTGNNIVGIWSKSASSPWGISPGAVATNAGYYKGQYQFRANGSYSFKGESWGGYSRPDEFWTIEENGTYSVSGDTLTIEPKTSTATLRDQAGVVKKSQNNRLEKATYKWKLHYFEGIGETNLVLQPTQPTLRDGSFAGNSAFQNSYLYSQGGKLEWRY